MGTADAGALVDKLVGAVPVLGSVWEAGRAIHNVFSSEAEEIKLINEEAGITTKIFDAQVARAKDLREIFNSVAASIRQMRFQIAGNLAESPYDEKLAGIRGAFDQNATGLKSKADADLEKIRNDFKTAREAEHANEENLRAKFRAKYGDDANEELDRAHQNGSNITERLQNAEYAADKKEIADSVHAQAALAAQQSQKLGERKTGLSEELKTNEDLRQSAIDKAMRDRREKELKDIDEGTQKKTEALDKQNREVEERLKKNRDDQLKAIEQQSEAEAALRAKGLKMLGKDLDAEISIIKAAADKKLDAAKTPAERDAILGLEALELLEAKQKNRSVLTKHTAAGTSAEDRFAGGRFESLTLGRDGSDPEKQTAANTKQILEILQKASASGSNVGVFSKIGSL